MADFVYDHARQHFSQGDINWLSDTIRLMLVNSTAGSGYTPSQANDEFLSAIPVACRTSTTAAFTTKTNVAGVLDADDPKFIAVTAGPANDKLIVYKDTGNPATSLLIAHITTYAGLPYTPTGIDVLVVFPDDVNKIFQL